ncbi:calsequestrin-1-like isoform X2 [Corticium candelabrum]|uniref:calsequestrin-1-like isoform X2 n=1 Tax=Corticium candelabrum TaxID=121492 RepID=UPI002E26DFF0|nr:calsequestrin-1-like isoform X2 [Corticium candelabrum]
MSQRRCAVVFFLVAIYCVCALHEHENPRWPQHDGKRRVLSLNADTFHAAVKKHPLLVVLFYVPPGHVLDPVKDKETSKNNWEQLEMTLEMTSQLLQKENVRTATINMIESYALVKALQIPSPGTILIYSKDRPSPHFYLGQRAMEVLAPYILKMLQPAVTEIIGKTQKKQYDQLDTAKVVGYFETSNDKGYSNFAKAAETFQPLIPFFVTFDKKLAKSLRVKKANFVIFDKPYEKYLTLTEPSSTEEIIDFVRGNVRQSLTKVQLENIHGTWVHGEEEKMLVAFVRPQTPDGAAFFSVVKSLARNYADENRTHFIWVDPDPLPNLHETWKTLYHIDMTQSNAFFGVVDGIKSARVNMLGMMSWKKELT